MKYCNPRVNYQHRTPPTDIAVHAFSVQNAPRWLKLLTFEQVAMRVDPFITWRMG